MLAARSPCTAACLITLLLLLIVNIHAQPCSDTAGDSRSDIIHHSDAHQSFIDLITTASEKPAFLRFVITALSPLHKTQPLNKPQQHCSSEQDSLTSTTNVQSPQHLETRGPQPHLARRDDDDDLVDSNEVEDDEHDDDYNLVHPGADSSATVRIAVGVGVPLGALIVAISIFFFWRRGRKARKQQDERARQQQQQQQQQHQQWYGGAQGDGYGQGGYEAGNVYYRKDAREVGMVHQESGILGRPDYEARGHG